MRNEGGGGVDNYANSTCGIRCAWETCTNLHKLARACTQQPLQIFPTSQQLRVGENLCLNYFPAQKKSRWERGKIAVPRGVAEAIDKVKEDNAPVAPHDLPQGVPGHSGCASVPLCVCVYVWLKRYKAHTSPWYIAAKFYMAQSGCSSAPPAAAAGQDAAWAAKNRNRKQRKRNVQKTRKRRQLVSSHVYHIYMYMLHGVYIA